MEAELRIGLQGTRALLMHNGRLANPLDPYTRAVSAISRKRTKTDEDLAELLALEARATMYETEDGLLGLPSVNIWRSLFDAAKAFKLGTTLARALLYGPEINPLTLDGEPLKADTWLDDNPEHVLYVPVRIGQSRTMRARARIPAGWQCSVTFTLLADEVQVERLQPVLQRAGRLIGLGDWRPVYGTFQAQIL